MRQTIRFWNNYKGAGFLLGRLCPGDLLPPLLIFYAAPPKNSCGSSPSGRAGASTFAAVIKGLPIRASTPP